MSWKKDMHGKPEMSILPARGLFAAAAVMSYGAVKYSRDNWKRAPSPQPYVDAALRHLYRWADGEACDAETGLSHLAHAAACVLIACHLETKPGQAEPDRAGEAVEVRVETALRDYMNHRTDEVST